VRRALIFGSVAAVAAAIGALVPARFARAEEREPSDSSAHTFVRASVGGAARGLYDSPMLGGEAALGIGIDTRSGAYSLGLSFFAGSTEGGFLTLHGTAGLDLAWRVGIVRLGFEPRVGYIGLDRETTDRQFGAYTFGLAIHGAVDVFDKNGTSFAIGLEPTADAAVALGSDGPSDGAAAPLYGGRAFFEIRYRAD
jgi:hypothetical protein